MIRSIELTTETDETACAAVWFAKAKGALSQGQGQGVDDEEVASFCRRLRGFTFRSYKRNMLAPDRTPLPGGYRNVRIIDARDGLSLGSIWWLGRSDLPASRGPGFRVVDERPTARSIIAICLCMPFEEITSWRATRALPPREPGLLELEVDIETRSRRLLPTDGSPLPPTLVERFAQAAPRRAESRPRNG